MMFKRINPKYIERNIEYSKVCYAPDNPLKCEFLRSKRSYDHSLLKKVPQKPLKSKQVTKNHLSSTNFTPKSTLYNRSQKSSLNSDLEQIDFYPTNTKELHSNSHFQTKIQPLKMTNAHRSSTRNFIKYNFANLFKGIKKRIYNRSKFRKQQIERRKSQFASQESLENQQLLQTQNINEEQKFHNCSGDSTTHGRLFHISSQKSLSNCCSKEDTKNASELCETSTDNIEQTRLLTQRIKNRRKTILINHQNKSSVVYEDQKSNPQHSHKISNNFVSNRSSCSGSIRLHSSQKSSLKDLNTDFKKPKNSKILTKKCHKSKRFVKNKKSAHFPLSKRMAMKRRVVFSQIQECDMHIKDSTYSY
ncbi:unnamed protein product [Moneuplotes crassus]|uniref:Uncharacterized protein n=1 Tax=Euplotes crassus TaxID=5936 RepID=A0AAD1X4V4_EUPCR|nr:unnamed protein product [Moneuplotes crassus]